MIFKLRPWDSSHLFARTLDPLPHPVDDTLLHKFSDLLQGKEKYSETSVPQKRTESLVMQLEGRPSSNLFAIMKTRRNFANVN